MAVQLNGKLRGTIQLPKDVAKEEAEKAALSERLGIEEGDLILFGADNWETSCVVLGRVRLHVAALQKLAIDPDRLDFLWIVDFPLLHHSAEEQRFGWGRSWGCNSDIGRLRMVLMHRPGEEMRVVDTLPRIPELGAFGDP